jgi:hypothetical protein
MTQDEKVVQKVIQILCDRAGTLRRGALITFGLILLALISGLLLFIFAGTITTGVKFTFTKSPTLSGTLPPSANSLAPLKSEEDPEERFDLIQSISTIATRAGAVLILMFLVQILVTLYRYNVRLVNFFDGRADALQLMNSEDEKKFQTLVGTIGGDTIEFGKVPKTPTEHAIVLATKILEVAQSKKE